MFTITRDHSGPNSWPMRQGGPGMGKSAAYPRKFAKKIFQEHSAFKHESWIFIQWDENAVEPSTTLYYSLLTHML